MRLTQRNTEAGILLVECLMYCTVLTVIFALALAAFNRMAVRTGELQRNTHDIERVLKAGELWRKDVRGATAQCRFEAGDDFVAFVIPQGTNEIIYSNDGTNIHRRVTLSPWQVTLAGVKQSRFELDKRDTVSAWRWEIELAQRQKVARVKPLFTFLAVPGAN